MALIYGTEGNDQGLFSLIGSTNDDTIHGLGGDDSIDGLAGNDTISVRVAGGFGDTVHGGAGTDSLSVQIDVAGAINFDSWGPGGHIQFVSASSSLAQLILMATGTTFKLGIGNYAYAGVAFDGTENLGIQAFNAVQNDLLVVFGQGTYDGGPGTDTLFADWSASGMPTVWNNLAAGAQGVNGSLISNVERLLIRTGSGDDDLRNTVAVTNDEFETGAGNDTVQAGGGADRIDLGDGDDFLRVISAAGSGDTVIGGAGTDALFIDASTSGESGIFWSGNDAGGQSVGGTVNNGSSLTSVAYLLASAFWLDMNTGNGLPGVIFNTIENLSIEASTTASHNDLLIVRGRGNYNGAGGTDTLFADWSLASLPIAWDNQAGATTQTVNGSTISNVERLLLRTGSGNDDIRNTVATTDDEFETGAGDDTIYAGAGLDRIDAGDGHDEIHLLVNTASNLKDTVNGAGGTDSLFADASAATGRLDWEAYGSGGNYLGMALYNSSMASIGSVLANASRYAISGLSFEGMENLSLLASANGSLDDLLVVIGSGTYSGGGGTDTLYADWSAAQSAVVWNNLAAASTHSVNGSAISAVERLLVKTGAGNDDLRNLVAGTNDEFESGAGNDLIYSGAGNDRINPGAGNDTVDGGAGTDTVVLAGNKSLYTVLRNAGSTSFIVTSSAEGTDSISNVENFQFADGTVAASSFPDVDNLAPTVVSYTPADEATGVATAANIVLAFSEPIQRGSGSIVLNNAAGSVIETFDAASSARLTVAGSTLTLDPSLDLASMTGYRVEFAAGSVRDLLGNGIAAVTTYNFTTGGASYTGTAGNDLLSGDAFNNSFTGAGGDDTIDGQGGIDTAIYAGPRDHYGISYAAGVRQVVDQLQGGVEGSDRLTSIERLQFSDISIAYDLSGNAGTVARLIGALFGAQALQDSALVGQYLSLLDNGASYEQLATVATASDRFAQAAGSHSNTDFVRQVYTNVVGVAPGAADLAFYVPQLDASTFTQATLAMLAADLQMNQDRINLTGLAGSGLAYAPAAAGSVRFGTSAADLLTGTTGNDHLYGLAGNDTLNGGAGNDSLEGALGTDRAVYTGASTNFGWAPAAGGWSVTDYRGPYTDSLGGIERLQFDNTHVALDLNGAAGMTAKILGAVFGASWVQNKQFVGIGLSVFDAGQTYEQVAQLALDAKLGVAHTNKQAVDLMYTNLVGVAPTAQQSADLVALIDTYHVYTQASLAVYAAELELNTVNIGFTGLLQTGIEYLPA